MQIPPHPRSTQSLTPHTRTGATWKPWGGSSGPCLLDVDGGVAREVCGEGRSRLCFELDGRAKLGRHSVFSCLRGEKSIYSVSPPPPRLPPVLIAASILSGAVFGSDASDNRQSP